MKLAISRSSRLGRVISALAREQCDCLLNPRVRRRIGGAVLGCPVHDPERTAERRAELSGDHRATLRWSQQSDPEASKR